MEEEDKSVKPIILVAEDTESNFLLASAILRENYQLEWAQNGIEAIEMYQKFHPAAILMDIHMPDMDGLAATTKIRELDKKIPIIAVTAYTFDSDRRNAMAVGCDSFISKPISIIELKSKLKEAIGK